MQSHPGSRAAHCRTLTTAPPGNPNLGCPLLSSLSCGGRKGVWEMVSPSLCKRKQDPKGGMILCWDGC